MVETFPLPGSSFKILRLILVGYLHQGGSDRKAVGPTDVGSAIGTDSTIVSRNNAFLAAIGLIEKDGRKWRLTEDGVAVGRALEYEAVDEVRSTLGDLLRGNDFAKKITTFLRGRGDVEQSQLAEHIARVAGAPKKPNVLTGARTVIEVMTHAGLVQDDGGVIRLRSDQAAEPRRDAASTERSTIRPEDASARRAETSGQPELRIELALTSDDLRTDEAVERLIVGIRQLIDGLA
jgi:hypothetical protein